MQNIQQSFFRVFHPVNNVFVPKTFVNLGEFYVKKKFTRIFPLNFM